MVQSDITIGFGKGLAQIEAGIVRDQGTGDHARRAFALPMHDHPAGAAHDIGRRLAKNAPAGGGNLRDVLAGIHLGEQDKLANIIHIDGDALLMEEGGVVVAGGGVVLAGQEAAGDGDREAVPRQPAQAVHRRIPAARPAFGLVDRLAVVIEADAQGQPVAVLLAQGQQRGLVAAHGLHRIGQHERFEPAVERLAEHLEHAGVHEGFAAGKADLARAHGGRFAQEPHRIGGRQIDQRIVGRAAFDVAAGAGKVAQRAGVQPQRVEVLQRHAGARFPPGGDLWIAELFAR